MKKLFTLITIIIAAYSVANAQTCDTLFNMKSPLDTPTFYLADTGTGAGYLSGNNEYGDLAKAEGFASVPGDYATSATLYFAVVTINAADSDSVVTIMVWDNTGATSEGNNDGPGNALDSGTVTLRQIAQAVTTTNNTQVITGVTVNFTHQAPLTDSFYVGVILPTVTGDTLALYTNTVPPGPNGNGWEYGVNAQTGSGLIWGSYNDDWQFAGGSEGNFISVDICGSAPIAAFTASDSAGCTPLTVNFTDKSAQIPARWNWSFGDGGTDTVQNPSHTYLTGGTYVVSETVGNGNGVDSISDTIVVLTSPVADLQATNPTSASSHDGVVTVDVINGTQPFTYIWSDDSTGFGISNLAPGTYSVTVTDQNGCSATASTVLAVTGISKVSGPALVSIYPNPATDVLNLVWLQKSMAEVSILDLAGNVITTFETSGEAKSIYDVHNLASGTYVVRIIGKESNLQQSLLFTKL
jgi:PKD repeat protein